MGIADERRVAELRYRRSRNRNLVRAIGYITSVIPAILIALNFETCREYAIKVLGGQPQPVAQAVSPAPQPQKPPPVVRREVPAPAPTHRPPSVPARQVRTRIEVQPVPMVRRQPMQLLPDEPEPDFEITLDLSKSRQRYAIESVSKVRVLPLDQGGEMSPSDGVIDAQTRLTITFSEQFNPHITVALDDDCIWLNYEVESATGRMVPFTTSNLAGIRRRVMRDGNQTTALISRLETEKSKCEAYLSASGGKLWTEKKAAEIRLKELPGLIASAQERVAMLANNLDAVDELIDLAKSIDGTKLGFVIETGEGSHLVRE